MDFNLLIQPKALLKKIYPKAVWNFNRSSQVIYLTFDDGPIPEITKWVLDELIKFNAQATFFCVGENIKQHPDIQLQYHIIKICAGGLNMMKMRNIPPSLTIPLLLEPCKK